MIFILSIPIICCGKVLGKEGGCSSGGSSACLIPMVVIILFHKSRIGPLVKFAIIRMQSLKTGTDPVFLNILYGGLPSSLSPLLSFLALFPPWTYAIGRASSEAPLKAFHPKLPLKDHAF